MQVSAIISTDKAVVLKSRREKENQNIIVPMLKVRAGLSARVGDLSLGNLPGRGGPGTGGVGLGHSELETVLPCLGGGPAHLMGTLIARCRCTAGH